ncbi:hypothetical protein MCAG_00047 [Micromonospora sp. ATCC 39149]|nr:hypothetical protein MCAG_00047 [Micromonospora sp. ATCC 39149]
MPRRRCRRGWPRPPPPRDATAAQLAAAREAAAAVEGRLGELDARLRAAEAERDAAQRRSAQLVDQVSDMAAALARLGAAPR